MAPKVRQDIVIGPKKAARPYARGLSSLGRMEETQQTTLGEPSDEKLVKGPGSDQVRIKCDQLFIG